MVWGGLENGRRGLARRTRIRWSMLEGPRDDRRGDGSDSFSDDRDSDDHSGRGAGRLATATARGEWSVVALEEGSVWMRSVEGSV